MSKILEELPEILSAQLIANYLGISRSTVYTLFQTKPEFGGIPNFEVGNSKRVVKVEFVNWIETRKKDKKEKVY